MAGCECYSAVKQLEKAARRNEVTVLTDVAQRSVGSVMKEAEPVQRH
jgi:hypothetical protein